jgi:hypothetical protein
MQDEDSGKVEELAEMLCDMRWGDGTYKAGGPKLNRSYWRRTARRILKEKAGEKE